MLGIVWKVSDIIGGYIPSSRLTYSRASLVHVERRHFHRCLGGGSSTRDLNLASRLGLGGGLFGGSLLG